jgi:N-acetyl-anhydromuramyl-L-alanine amidase AmpD
MGTVRKPAVKHNAIGKMATHGAHTPRRVILHTTESGDVAGVSDVSGVFAFWRQQGRGYGAHLVIDAEGNTGQGAYGNAIVWATYGANTGSLQIEMVGRAKWTMLDWVRPSRRRQLNEVAKWIAWWNLLYDIPIRFDTDAGVCRHRDFPAGGHTDPGAGFPLGWVLKRARAYRRTGW